ncbi:c-type cytochrome [Halarcobacter anaerophilus]|uniref:Cytochrome C n=1 Tax=Halarcobacter anaerophilus TaxID=877500 RepID=A0A4Q0Y5G1_9BACT|nr:cytochrome c [Halarcobacter anaerophilus]QDF28944.1 putative membrane protein [Halarcobacter anaerophilus]RXJ63581.1 cytochrome C [Halarcobacter anaerophilus]
MDIIGQFPLFYFPEYGSAWMMGMTGTIHILVSHTSVGAAMLFAFLAYKAYKENRTDLYPYMKKYGMFLLIFSYVVGSITGPGIWYTATAASPRGISALIHNFVWVWATEWVFFVYEVIGVFVLVYFIDKIDKKTHLKLTYTFAIASVGTLALIIGIISFMMWPGTAAYYATGSASDAFFGINTFPHMFLRIGFMIMMSGVIGLVISSAMKKENAELSQELTKKMGYISLFGGFVTMFFFMWYMGTLPDNAHAVFNITKGSVIQTRIILAIVFSAYFLIAILRPKIINTPIASIMIAVILLAGLWPGEKLRESMRKPYVAGQYIYSNQIISRDVEGKGIKSELPLIAQKGLLKVNPFVPERLRVITDENKLEVGELLTKMSCSNCHSLEKTGVYRPLKDRLTGMDKEGVKAILYAIGNGGMPYMPTLKLPDEEYDAIAEYIASLKY